MPRAVADPVADRASPAGTARYAQRLADACDPAHFVDAWGLRLSSLGIGTAVDGDESALEEALAIALSGGINVVDTAANYRGGEAEEVVGRALRRLSDRGLLARDECFLVTKGGYVRPASGRGADTHSLSVASLQEQLRASAERLDVACIDAYLVHNPEVQLDTLARDELERALRAAFEMLEGACGDGLVATYGVSTWHAFDVPSGHELHLELGDLERLAAEAAGGEHHFRVVELPVSAATPHAVLPHQTLAGRELSVLEVAFELGLIVLASASLGGPGRTSRRDARDLAQVPRSLPGITTALVGTGRPEHATELAALAAEPLLTHDSLARALAEEDDPDA